MNIKKCLNQFEKLLKYEGINTARLDCLVLLEDVTSKDRAWLLAHPEFELTSSQLKMLDAQIKRRAKHEPLAYIRTKSEFYGREFIVNPDTLEPRPETETMVELALKVLEQRAKSKEQTIIDVGTGSGCIAITIKLELSQVKVLATEINEKALQIAKQNAKKLNADIKFYRGDLLEPVSGSKPFSLLCNLPYVPNDFTINKAAMQEPKIAIYGGKDGLNLYRRMFEQTLALASLPKFIFTESLPFQHDALAKIAKKHGYKLETSDDFIQYFIKD